MPKARKRKTPITVLSRTEHTSSRPRSSRNLIRRFHLLLKKQARLQESPRGVESAKALADVDREIEDLGGLAAYQRMSSIGQGEDRGGGSEKMLISWLHEMGMSSEVRNDRPRYAIYIIYWT